MKQYFIQSTIFHQFIHIKDYIKQIGNYDKIKYNNKKIFLFSTVYLYVNDFIQANWKHNKIK